MVDLVVIGGGYWGVAAAVTARRRGLNVLHVDDGRPESASRAASAHFAFGWYKGPWAARVRAAYEQAELFGLTFDWRGAVVNSPKERKAGQLFGGRVREDWAIFDPWQYLSMAAPDRRPVAKVEPGHVLFEDGETVSTRGIYVAAGVWTDELLARSHLPQLGVSALRGTGLLVRAAEPSPGRVYVHALNPFKQIAIRPWGEGVLRLGETSEARPDPEHYVAKMLGQVSHLGLPVPFDRVSGLRPMLAEPTVREVAPGIVAGSGGGRIGAVLGFWAAEEAWEILRGKISP